MAVKPEHAPSLIDSLQSEVATEASPMMQFLVNHARTIALGIVVFIVAIAGYWVYSWNSGKQQTAALQELGRVIVIADASERLKALDAYLASAPAATKNAVLFAQAEAAQELKDYARAYSAWEAISKIDPTVKVTGTFGMVQALIAQEKYKEALGLLEGISSKTNVADVVNVNSQIIVIAENLGDYKRAIAACDTILSQPELVTDMNLWSQKKAALEQEAAAKK